MSVEICSKFTGKIGVTTKQGQHSTVTFYEKHDETGPIGFAVVTHEQAERFLKIPDEYWKPGTRGQTRTSEEIVNAALAADPAAQQAADELLGGSAPLTLAQIPDALKEEMRQQFLAELKPAEDTRTPAQKAKDTKEAKKNGNLAPPFEKKAADPADTTVSPLLDAIKLAETPEEVDAVVGANENPEVIAAATERKAELAPEAK